MPGLEDPTRYGIRDEQERVYIAGPYTHGKWGRNQRNVIEAAQEVLEAGHIPFIPHTMTGIWSIMYDNEWIKFDLKWMEACDCVIRLPGESDGADTEVEFASEMGMEVFHSVENFKAEKGLYE